MRRRHTRRGFASIDTLLTLQISTLRSRFRNNDLIIQGDGKEACQILRISKTHRSSTSSAYLERVNRAIDYIVDRLSEPLRLGEVARAARLSPFHFHRI